LASSMRQKRTVRASSVWARRRVWLGHLLLLREGRLRWPLSTPNPRNRHLAREYWADHLVTGDNGLLGMSDQFASSTLDLPGLGLLTPRDFIQQIER
jgi:hypothetical protein